MEVTLTVDLISSRQVSQDDDDDCHNHQKYEQPTDSHV